MSFILDALKKSESDRQRQSGPGLYEVKIAPPKARFPLWAVAVALLLGANMIIVGWLLLRRTATHGEVAAQPPTSVPTSNQPSTSGPAPTQGLVPTPGLVQAAGRAPGQASTPAPGQAPAAMVASSVPASTSMRGSVSTSTPQSLEAAPASQPYDLPSGAPAQPNMSEPTPTNGNQQTAAPNSESTTGVTSPDDYAPAADPNTPSPFAKGHVRRGTESGLMLYQDVAATPGSDLPELRLDLHVYAVKPQDRFALVNMRKVHEGDSLQNGVRVESITPDGVVMSHNGTKFLLPREP